jgi:hypothetical protein
VTDSGGERRTNHALRRRIDKLIGRVHEARAEIVERGLDAVHEDAPPDGLDKRDGKRATATDDIADART